nr:MAG TPA: hypothetical protein [Caudoviricetes sp.]
MTICHSFITVAPAIFSPLPASGVRSPFPRQDQGDNFYHSLPASESAFQRFLKSVFLSLTYVSPLFSFLLCFVCCL